MNFGRVMAGSLGTALMVTFMSIGAQWVVSSSEHASKEMISDKVLLWELMYRSP